ncbi:hypothetical protein ACFFBA_000587, partial [Sneathia vaginalis]|uniref:hypothetical protein n=1 Tax=Sneathia vaginalis TaxID=187101 RepID=UPI00372CE9AB
GAFVQHVHYANAELGDYAANPLEYLYAQSLISSNKDFFKKYAKDLEKAKKEFEKAQETIKKATKDEKEAYQKNVDIYNKLVAAYDKKLSDDVTNAKTAYDGVAEANKEKAKKAYDAQKEINKIQNEIDELDELIPRYEALYTNAEVKADAKDEEIKKAEVKALTDKKTDKQKLIAINSDLYKAANDNDGATGKAYAVAENEQAKFNRNKKESDKYALVLGMQNVIADKKFNKGADDTYTVADNGTVEANKVFNDSFGSVYGQALQAVNRYNDFSIREKEYKFALEQQYKDLKAKLDLVNFGFKLGAKYTGVKNLTLTADGVFGGRHHSGFSQIHKFPAYTTGYVKLHAGAKYDFKLLNDKLVVSPEGNVTAKFTDIYAGICNPSLVLAPKVSVSYKPMDALKVAGSVEVPVNFGLNTLGDFGYQSTSIKGALNMKYEWK